MTSNSELTGHRMIILENINNFTQFGANLDPI